MSEVLEVLHENNNYTVELGEILDDRYLPKEHKVPGYRIINKKTKVVEGETSILPRAIMYASEFDAGLAGAEELTSPQPSIQFAH